MDFGFGVGGGGGGGLGTDFCTAKNYCVSARKCVWEAKKKSDIVIQFLQLVPCCGVTLSGV